MQNTEEESGEICSNRWKYNSPLTVEVITLMNLIKSIEKNTKELKKGSITVYHDNYKVVNTMNQGLEKAIQGVLDEGALVSEIIEIIQ